ncbi:MAG TPA: endolytic transglycosylase MltG [Caulobacteraceae bacterium]|nr:endolytic transglycosylase MltG [Caulobacteraceae bacterium]
MSRKPRAVARARRKGRGRAIRKIGARRGGMLLLTLAALVVAWAGRSYFGPGPTAPKGERTTVYIAPGSGLSAIASALDEAGVINSRLLFRVAAHVVGDSTKLRAGEYEFASKTSMRRVLDDIRAGRVVRRQVVVPEGFTSGMVAARLMAEPALTGPVAAPPEGAILPATYDFQRGEPRAAVVKRMTDAQTRLLAELWAKRAPDLPIKTPQEAVTLASIVEKETALPAERPRIAAVFTNRLRKGMRLESDPTIIYGITKGLPLRREIRLSEVKAQTPYNTYAIAGLPPTPIANPGRASLEAVLNPPKTTELFFVADGTGGHVFASTFEEHQRNVTKWRQIKAQQMAAGVR